MSIRDVNDHWLGVFNAMAERRLRELREERAAMERETGVVAIVVVVLVAIAVAATIWRFR